MQAIMFKRDIVELNEKVKSEKQQHSTINRTSRRFIQQGAFVGNAKYRNATVIQVNEKKKTSKNQLFSIFNVPYY